jgi:hypothetical protein
MSHKELRAPPDKGRPLVLSAQTAPGPGNRIRIFVDYWNLQLTMNEQKGSTFRFDWTRLPRWLTERAADLCHLAHASYEGMHVYSSYNPDSLKDLNHKRWAQN